jgi:hypothetical protein
VVTVWGEGGHGVGCLSMSLLYLKSASTGGWEWTVGELAMGQSQMWSDGFMHAWVSGAVDE